MGNGGKHRRFWQGEFSGRFVKVNPRGRFDPVGQVSVEVGVEIPLENLFFAVGVGYLIGKQKLFRFSAVVVKSDRGIDDAPFRLD